MTVVKTVVAADKGEQAANTVETAAHEVAAIEIVEAADKGEQAVNTMETAAHARWQQLNRDSGGSRQRRTSSD